MLLSLSIRDFVIVDLLDLDFSSGFTVLTGETGAGKSIMIDALSLLLGGRGEGSLVRQGAERAELAARFDLSQQPAVLDWLAEQALSGDDDTLLVRRLVDHQGRSRAFLNGRPATLAQLKSVGEHLVDIHGQHAHQSLLRAEAQRVLLDDFAGAQAEAAAVRHAHTAWQTAAQALRHAQGHAEANTTECERLDWQIGELASLAPTEGEWESLGLRHQRLSHIAELSLTAQSALGVLSDDDSNVVSLLTQQSQRLARLAGADPAITPITDLLASAEAELREAVYALRDYTEHLEEDPAALTEVEKRLDALHSAGRKFRTPPELLPEKWADWQRQRAALDTEVNLDVLAEHATQAHAALVLAAAALTAKRQYAAEQLSTQVSQEMQHLAMEGSRFQVVLLPQASPNASGAETVEYHVAANAGTSLRPLAKVASGGELSRISLALQVVTSQVAAVPTLIFDEVDVGIGGRVAEVVGRLLNRLGTRYQVLCVTHLPQVAARGNTHWQVSKSPEQGQIVSRITPLTDSERVAEIARMLGGATLTDTTRRHAAELLAGEEGA